LCAISFFSVVQNRAAYQISAAAADLSVSATITDGELSYQWYSKTSLGEEKTPINGATTATLASANIDTSRAGTTYYYVVVTNTNDGVNRDKEVSFTSDFAKVVVEE
jgi:hypothetical protein